MVVCENEASDIKEHMVLAKIIKIILVFLIQASKRRCRTSHHYSNHSYIMEVVSGVLEKFFPLKSVIAVQKIIYKLL